MKRTSALCLAAALTVGLAGCSSSGRSGDNALRSGSDGRDYGGAYSSGAYDSGTGYRYDTNGYTGDGSMLDDAGDTLRNGLDNAGDAVRRGVDDARNGMSGTMNR